MPETNLSLVSFPKQTFWRKVLSQFDSQLGVRSSLFAVRRETFAPLCSQGASRFRRPIREGSKVYNFRNTPALARYPYRYHFDVPSSRHSNPNRDSMASARDNKAFLPNTLFHVRRPDPNSRLLPPGSPIAFIYLRELLLGYLQYKLTQLIIRSLPLLSLQL